MDICYELVIKSCEEIKKREWEGILKNTAKDFSVSRGQTDLWVCYALHVGHRPYIVHS